MKEGRVKVGDFVEVDEKNKSIEKLYPRTNELVRPPVSNVGQVLILVATTPKPDKLLLDKLLIRYFSLNIKPIVVVNKIDLPMGLELLAEMQEEYGSVCRVIGVSSLNAQEVKEKLGPMLENEFTLLTGQSAVGKTSLLRALLPSVDSEVGTLSKRTERGKNTTRKSEIYELDSGGLIADSPGFSAFMLENFAPEDILDYTIELRALSRECKYNNCKHIGESEEICAVKRAVREGKFNKNRYARFVEIMKVAKELEDKKYE